MENNNLLNKNNVFEIIPDTSLWMKLGKTKYTIPKALAELIDNSVDSRVENKVKVDIHFQIEGDYIGILDNGRGMSPKDLKRALTIAHHNNEEKQIGEYGFGLKSATSYLGKKLYIYTRTKDMDKYIKFYYDENEFINKQKWNIEYELIDRDQMKVETEVDFERGTYILVKDLNVKLYKRLTMKDDRNGILIPKFRRMYKLLLKNKILELRLCPKTKLGKVGRIINIEPYEIDKLTTKISFDFIIKYDEKELNINGWAGILPIFDPLNDEKNKDVYKYNGFLVSKNNKIILENESIGYNFHPERRLIIGEIELENFETLNNKSDFLRNNDWQILELILRTCIVNPLLSISNSKFINQFKSEYINKCDNWLDKKIDINYKLNSFITNIKNKQLNDKQSELNLEISPFEIVKYNIDVDFKEFSKYVEYINIYRSEYINNINYKKQYNGNEKRIINSTDIIDKKIEKKYIKDKVDTKPESLDLIDKQLSIKIDDEINKSKDIESYYYDIILDSLHIIHKYEVIEESDDEFIYSNDENKVLHIVSNKSKYDDRLEVCKNFCINNIINAVLEYKIINIHKEISLDKDILKKLRRECSTGIRNLIG